MGKEPFDKVKYNHDYTRKYYDRINLTLPKGSKDIIAAYADSRQESINAVFARAIKAELENSGIKINI